MTPRASRRPRSEPLRAALAAPAVAWLVLMLCTAPRAHAASGDGGDAADAADADRDEADVEAAAGEGASSHELGLALVATRPALLDPGLAQGVAVAYTAGPLVRRGALALRAGADLGWDQATESSLSWLVTHDELRLRLALEASLGAGVGAALLRLAAGATWVHETRTRHQSARLEGGAMTVSADAVLPTLEAQLGAQVHLAGNFALRVRAGPAVHLRLAPPAGAARALPGFAGAVELRWTP